MSVIYVSEETYRIHKILLLSDFMKMDDFGLSRYLDNDVRDHLHDNSELSNDVPHSIANILRPVSFF